MHQEQESPQSRTIGRSLNVVKDRDGVNRLDSSIQPHPVTVKVVKNSSIEKMEGGMKLECSFFARAFLKKWEGLFPGKTIRNDE
jgi:hypothetical protein